MNTQFTPLNETELCETNGGATMLVTYSMCRGQMLVTYSICR